MKVAPEQTIPSKISNMAIIIGSYVSYVLYERPQ